MKASIDIGSNSLLLLVVDDAGKVVQEEARVVGLGKGLGDRGVFRPDRMEEAIRVLKEYAQFAQARGVPPESVRAVATSASRRALNATNFYAQVRTHTRLRVEVISGEEEARLTWLGGKSGLEVPDGPVVLVDPGGGSTEVILGEGERILYRTSLEIGTVRLTEQCLGYGVADTATLARARAVAAQVISSVELPAIPRAAIAVAGTATTLAATELGLDRYDPARVHGSILSAGGLRRQIDLLLGATPDMRRQIVRASPDRADTVLAGAIILLQLLEQIRRQSFRISDRGLRYGLLAG